MDPDYHPPNSAGPRAGAGQGSAGLGGASAAAALLRWPRGGGRSTAAAPGRKNPDRVVNSNFTASPTLDQETERWRTQDAQRACADSAPPGGDVTPPKLRPRKPRRFAYRGDLSPGGASSSESETPEVEAAAPELSADDPSATNDAILRQYPDLTINDAYTAQILRTLPVQDLITLLNSIKKGAHSVLSVQSCVEKDGETTIYVVEEERPSNGVSGDDAIPQMALTDGGATQHASGHQADGMDFLLSPPAHVIQVATEEQLAACPAVLEDVALDPTIVHQTPETTGDGEGVAPSIYYRCPKTNQLFSVPVTHDQAVSISAGEAEYHPELGRVVPLPPGSSTPLSDTGGSPQSSRLADAALLGVQDTPYYNGVPEEEEEEEEEMEIEIQTDEAGNIIGTNGTITIRPRRESTPVPSPPVPSVPTQGVPNPVVPFRAVCSVPASSSAVGVASSQGVTGAGPLYPAVPSAAVPCLPTPSPAGPLEAAPSPAVSPLAVPSTAVPSTTPNPAVPSTAIPSTGRHSPASPRPVPTRSPYRPILYNAAHIQRHVPTRSTSPQRGATRPPAAAAPSTPVPRALFAASRSQTQQTPSTSQSVGCEDDPISPQNTDANQQTSHSGHTPKHNACMATQTSLGLNPPDGRDRGDGESVAMETQTTPVARPRRPPRVVCVLDSDEEDAILETLASASPCITWWDTSSIIVHDTVYALYAHQLHYEECVWEAYGGQRRRVEDDDSDDTATNSSPPGTRYDAMFSPERVPAAAEGRVPAAAPPPSPGSRAPRPAAVAPRCSSEENSCDRSSTELVIDTGEKHVDDADDRTGANSPEWARRCGATPPHPDEECASPAEDDQSGAEAGHQGSELDTVQQGTAPEASRQGVTQDGPRQGAEPDAARQEGEPGAELETLLRNLAALDSPLTPLPASSAEDEDTAHDAAAEESAERRAERAAEVGDDAGGNTSVESQPRVGRKNINLNQVPEKAQGEDSEDEKEEEEEEELEEGEIACSPPRASPLPGRSGSPPRASPLPGRSGSPPRAAPLPRRSGVASRGKGGRLFAGALNPRAVLRAKCDVLGHDPQLQQRRGDESDEGLYYSEGWSTDDDATHVQRVNESPRSPQSDPHAKEDGEISDRDAPKETEDIPESPESPATQEHAHHRASTPEVPLTCPADTPEVSTDASEPEIKTVAESAVATQDVSRMGNTHAELESSLDSVTNRMDGPSQPEVGVTCSGHVEPGVSQETMTTDQQSLNQVSGVSSFPVVVLSLVLLSRDLRKTFLPGFKLSFRRWNRAHSCVCVCVCVYVCGVCVGGSCVCVCWGVVDWPLNKPWI